MRAIACMPKQQVAWFSRNDVKAKFDDQESELREMKQQVIDLFRAMDEQRQESLDLLRTMDEQKQESLNMQKKLEEVNQLKQESLNMQQSLEEFNQLKQDSLNMQQSLEEFSQLKVWLGRRGATLDSLVQTFEEKQITWSVECGNRVLEILDKEVDKVTEGADPKTSYITLVRSLERSPERSLENESVVVAAEQAVIDLLHYVRNFPKDTGSLRMQMREFVQVREYRHSVTHMRYKEGGEQMLQNVSKVEQWMTQQLIPMTSTFSGVVAGGIALIRAKQESQETEKKSVNKPASPKVKGKKQTTIELVVRSTFGSRLFVVQRDDPAEKKIPLFVNAKGDWTGKLPLKEDALVYYLLGVQGSSVHRGPDFTVDSQLKKCFVEWEESGKAETATSKASEGEMPWLGHIVTISLVSLALISWWSSMKQVTA